MALATVRRRISLGGAGSSDRRVVEAMLADNQRGLITRLRAELHTYETRYEIPSAHIRQALVDGRLRDTEDVCNWVIAWESYRAAAQAGPARLE